MLTLQIHGRRYVLRPSALEFFLTECTTVFFNFPESSAPSAAAKTPTRKLVVNKIERPNNSTPSQALLLCCLCTRALLPTASAFGTVGVSRGTPDYE